MNAGKIRWRQTLFYIQGNDMTTSTLSTLTSLRILIPLILLLSAVAIYLNRQKQNAQSQTDRSNPTVKTISVFTIVLMVIYFLVYLYLTFGFRTPSPRPIMILRPFWSYREAIQVNPLKIRRLGLARQILLNIFLTIPAGLLLPILYRTKHPYLHSALTILLLSLLTEIFQYITCLGFTETDDVINNFMGGLLGMGIVKAGSIQGRDHDHNSRG